MAILYAMVFVLFAVATCVTFILGVSHKKDVKKQAKLTNVLSEKVYFLAGHQQEMKTQLYEMKDQHRHDIESLINRHNSDISMMLQKHDLQIQELQTQSRELRDEIARLHHRIDVSDNLLKSAIPARPSNVFSLVK